MDIDKQDDILVEYDDGDAPMRNDADVIVVDEADAEMVDDAEVVKQDDSDDAPMVDDAADVVPIAVEEVIVEETEIVMQPAEEDQEGDNDGDTPMREEEDDPVVRLVDEEAGVPPAAETTSNMPQPSEETAATSSTTADWPPQPTDVPAVPSLLPSALAVPQDIKHEEGKIHDATLHSAAAPSDSLQGQPVDQDAASVIAEAESPATSRPPTILAATQLREAEQRDTDAVAETQSNFVEPAESVRESEFGTGMTGTAPNSVAGDAAEERASTLAIPASPLANGDGAGRDGKWPPAPTEVPAVPSLLPSALAVPDVAAPDADNSGDAQISRGDRVNTEKEAGREESASVVAEPAGSVRAGEGEGSVREDAEVVRHGTAEQDDDAASSASVLGDAPTIAGTQQHLELPPIVIVIDSTRHQPLFSSLPVGVDYPFPEPASESGDQQQREWDTSSPILPDLQAELADAPMSELFMALRVSLGEEFAEERGKELVIYQEELGLKVGEDNKHAEQVTLNDIIRLHTGCGCPQPVVFHLEHDSQRFIARYEAIRKILADAREDGEEEDEVVEDDEGETVYIDAYDEEGEDDELAFEDHVQHREEIEEDELAQDTTTEDPVDPSKLNGGVQAVRQVTEEILEYEEDEGTISPGHNAGEESTITAPKARETDTDQFGVDAAIRVAEEAAGAATSPDTAHQEDVTSVSTPSTSVTGATPSAKRPLEEGDSAQSGNVEGERHVKRKLSPDGEGADGEA